VTHVADQPTARAYGRTEGCEASSHRPEGEVMSATGIQNSSTSVHTGSAWSWVGVAAVMVLILTVLSIGLARNVGETTGPVVRAPVAQIQSEAPAKDLVLHGRGLVDMPDQVAAAEDGAAATKSTANETSSTGAGIVSGMTCPERLALKGLC
jgi:hypothetical protein